MTPECLVCRWPVPDYEPEYCCDGRECGCRGEPVDPCVCSQRCHDALMAGIGKPYERRRADAGIPLWGGATEGGMKMRVKYLGASVEQVRWGGNDDPRGLLQVGGVYEVSWRKIHSWHTKIELVGFPGKRFNDASFEYVAEPELSRERKG